MSSTVVVVVPVVLGFIGTAILAMLGIIYTGITKRLDIIDSKLDSYEARLTRLESWKELITLPDVGGHRRRLTDQLED